MNVSKHKSFLVRIAFIKINYLHRKTKHTGGSEKANKYFFQERKNLDWLMFQTKKKLRFDLQKVFPHIISLVPINIFLDLKFRVYP